MSALISTILYIIAVYFFARHEAYIDSLKIGLNMPIRHKRSFIERAIIVGFAALVAALFMGWPSFFLMIIGGAFGFSGIFRWYLNKYRGLNRFYISPSNWYDWQFMWIVGWNRNAREEVAKDWVKDYFHTTGTSRYLKHHAHRAGRIAYLTEGLIVGICLTIHILTI